MAVPTPPGNFVIEFESQEDSATEAGGDTDYSINMPGLGTYPILLVDSTTQLESETQSITCISETPLALQPQVSTIDDNDSGDNNDNNTNKKSKGKHHTGPYNINYIEDDLKRNKTYGKRSKTILKNAEHLHLMTGAEVKVEIKFEGKPMSYCSHEIETESIKLQTEQLAKISPLKRLRPLGEEIHTPVKKIPRTPKISSSSTITAPLMVEDLPGSKKKSSKACQICCIAWESDEDKSFRKSKMNKTTWVGCDRARCQYWAHASCIGIFIKPGEDVSKKEFLCGKHKKR